MPKSAPYLPNANQELLLKAALWDGEPARESFRAWNRNVAFDDIDNASQRLIPLLLDNLLRLGIEHRDERMYQGVARHVWLENQLRARTAQEALALFAEAGIPAMPLKGLAVTPLYYGNFRLRPMADVDILVPVAMAAEAGRLLSGNGWQSPQGELLGARDFLAAYHAAHFTNPHGVEIDLHWHVSRDCCWPDADEMFWRHSQPMTFNGFKTRTLSDTDHLFHTCIHGGRPSEMSPIRWVADAAKILRTATIDWQRLFQQTEDCALVLRMQITLGYLRERLALPMPDAAFSQLMALRTSAVERFEERVVRSRAPAIVKSSVRGYAHYRRYRSHMEKDEGFLRYLEMSFGTRSLAGTIAWVTHQASRGWLGRRTKSAPH